jgi:hypothetical protein
MGQQETLALQQTALLFNDLIGGGEQIGRHRQAERLGGFEVEHRFVLGRRLHRQVGRLGAAEYAIYVAGCVPALFDLIRSVGDQAAAGSEVTVGVDRGQSVSGRQLDD